MVTALIYSRDRSLDGYVHLTEGKARCISNVLPLSSKLPNSIIFGLGVSFFFKTVVLFGAQVSARRKTNLSLYELVKPGL